MQRLVKTAVLPRVKHNITAILPTTSSSTTTTIVPSLSSTTRQIHNASNPHQSKKQLQHQVQLNNNNNEPAPVTVRSPPQDNTPITNTIFKSENLLAYTHSHIRTQRFSPTDRTVTQLSQFDQILSTAQQQSRFGDFGL